MNSNIMLPAMYQNYWQISVFKKGIPFPGNEAFRKSTVDLEANIISYFNNQFTKCSCVAQPLTVCIQEHADVSLNSGQHIFLFKPGSRRLKSEFRKIINQYINKSFFFILEVT